jgi:hypothetical protein
VIIQLLNCNFSADYETKYNSFNKTLRKPHGQYFHYITSDITVWEQTGRMKMTEITVLFVNK